MSKHNCPCFTQTICMIWLAVIVAVLLLLLYPFGIRVEIEGSLTEVEATVRLQIGWLPCIKRRVLYEHGEFTVARLSGAKKRILRLKTGAIMQGVTKSLRPVRLFWYVYTEREELAQAIMLASLCKALSGALQVYCRSRLRLQAHWRVQVAILQRNFFALCLRGIFRIRLADIIFNTVQCAVKAAVNQARKNKEVKQ